MIKNTMAGCCGASTLYNEGQCGLTARDEEYLRRKVKVAKQSEHMLCIILRDRQVAKGGDEPAWASADEEKKRAHFRKVLKELGFKKVARWNNGVHNSKLNLFVYHPYEGGQKMRGW